MCCLDPFGRLELQVVVNLLPAAGVVDERSCRERTKWPSEGLPKGGTHVLAVCVTIQLDDCVALALLQHGERSAFRKRKGCLLYTSPSPRDGLLSRMPSSA